MNIRYLDEQEDQSPKIRYLDEEDDKKKKEAKVPQNLQEYKDGAPEWLRNVGGALGGVADVVGGIPGAIAGVLAGGATAIGHGDAKGGLEVAQNTMQGGLPSSLLNQYAGTNFDTANNAGYNAVMKLPTMVGEILHESGKGYGEIAKLLGAGQGAQEQTAAAMELALMGAGLKPGAKSPAAPQRPGLPGADVAANLEAMRREPTMDQAPVQPPMADAGAQLGYKNQVNAEQAARLEASIARQPMQQQAPMYVGRDGVASPDMPSAQRPAGTMPTTQDALPLASSPEQIAAQQAIKSPQRDMFVEGVNEPPAPPTPMIDPIQVQKEAMWAAREAEINKVREATALDKNDSHLEMQYDPVFQGNTNGGMYRGQRGAVNVKDITDAITKLVSKESWADERINNGTLSKNAPLDRQDYAQMIPGMGDAAKAVIPRPGDMASVIAKDLASGADVPAPIHANIAGGPEMLGWRYKNPVISEYSKWFQWADKKSKHAQETLVVPMEKQIAHLPRADLETIAGVLKSEMNQKAAYSSAELASAGMSPRLIEAKTKFRETMDTAYEIQAEQLRRQGKEPPTREEAHLASMRGGDYHISINEPGTGKTAWYVQAKTMAEARLAAQWFKDNIPGLPKEIKITVDKAASLPGIPKDILGGWQELMSTIDTKSEAHAFIKEAIDNANREAGYRHQGQDKRFLEKNFVRGFEGDMPWLTPHQNAVRLMDNQVNYLKNAYKWVYTNDALMQAKEVLSNKDMIANRPNVVEYLKKVTQSHMGMQEHLARKVETKVMQGMGLSRSLLQSGAGNAGRATSLLQLGGSWGYILATPITAANSIGVMAREGIVSSKGFVSGLADSSAAIVNLMLDETQHKQRLPMTKLGKFAYAYMKDNGIIVEGMFGDMNRVGTHPTESKALGAYSATISVPERVQRATVFMQMVHGLEATKQYSNMYDLFQRAETLTEVAATNFRSGELPIGVDKMGVAGGALFKYKAPVLNYWNQLYTYAHDVKTAKGTAAKAAATKPLLGLLGMTAVLGGVQDLPFVNELDSGFELIKKMLSGSNTMGPDMSNPELYAQVRDFSVKGTIRESMPEIVAYGTVQTMLGAQMSQRFGTDLIDLENPISSALPALGMVGNMGKSILDAGKGNFAQAAWNMSPQMVRGQMETKMDQFKTPYRENGYVRPSDIRDPSIYMTRNEDDTKKRALGLRSAREANMLEQRAMNNKQNANDRAASDRLVKNMLRDLQNNNVDAIPAKAVAWGKMNPDADLNSVIKQAIMSSTFTKEERAILSGKIGATQNAMKVIDAGN